jgi:NADH-quinone oxidoreductase subunit D
MTTHDHDTEVFEDQGTHESFSDAYGASVDEGLDGAPVFNVSGGDWNDLVDEATALHEERIVVNMGPQHPSTHGVLRLILELDGETVTEARAGIGYLHTGIEKNMEFRTWVQGVTFCTRMDYLTPMFQETAYCLSVEKLLGITDQIPERANIIRVLMMELTRINSHLVCLGTGGMELGATTVMTVGFRERERILRVFEAVTGLRMNNAYIRPGGVAQDLPHGAIDRSARSSASCARASTSSSCCSTRTRCSRAAWSASATST